MSQRLLDRFVRLCETPSPSGSERAVAEMVRAELEGLGVEVVEDGTAAETGAEAGNLIARIPGGGEGWVMLAAHLDTVPHDEPISVVLEDGVYRSAGDTILGSDNKAAVTVLVELAARCVEQPPPIGVELVFTVGEEDGLRGAKALDLTSLRSRFGLVLDHAGPIGELVVASPTYQMLKANFRGQEAHAGICPEQGHSAIAAAATAIGAMKLGRLDPETTANIGVIRGGTAANVVPAHCRVVGEARSIDPVRAAETLGTMIDACTWGAGEAACDVDIEVEEYFRGYRLNRRSAPVEAAAAALERHGHHPAYVTTGGGSDANALIAAGFECVNVGNGTTAVHTPDESVTAASLMALAEVAVDLVEESASRC